MSRRTLRRAIAAALAVVAVAGIAVADVVGAFDTADFGDPTTVPGRPPT